MIIFWPTGQGAGPAGSCDYPAVGDVQEGVTFGSGSFTGILDVPAAGDVRLGVGYGAGGTEFTGTLAVPSNSGGSGTSHSPAEVVAQMLIDLGEGSDPASDGAWPCGYSSEPADLPDNRITVYDTTGADFGGSMIDGELWGTFGIQVRVRAATHGVGWTKLQGIQDVLA